MTCYPFLLQFNRISIICKGIGIIVLFTHCVHLIPENGNIEYYGYDVGDISFQEELDDPEFKICDSIQISTRRNGLKYAHGQDTLINACRSGFQNIDRYQSYTGYIVLRFTVNCNRESDRFRISSLDNYFIAQDCPDQLCYDVLAVGKSLDFWLSRSDRDEGVDFSKFLNFKFENGQFIAVIQ